MANDEIIEKRASSPVATSCLVVAAAALVGSIGIQLVEVRQLRADGDIARTQSEISRLASAAQKVIDENTEGDDRRDFYQEAHDAVESGDEEGDGTEETADEEVDEEVEEGEEEES